MVSKSPQSKTRKIEYNRAMMMQIRTGRPYECESRTRAMEKLGRSNLTIALFRRVNLTNNRMCK